MKKVLIRLNVVINDYCFKRVKEDEYDKDIDYSNVQHSICFECFKKTASKNRNGNYTQNFNNKEYQVVKCNICGIKHLIDQEEWDEHDKSETCCKCIVY
mgnify:CR=1 FL=1